MKKLVIVESPAKARTIEKYLGVDYKVLATIGHIRELPKKGAIDPANNYAMTCVTIPGKEEAIKKITSALKTTDEIILATDPDREGEAIAWHVSDLLKTKHAKKIEGKEITKMTPAQKLKSVGIAYILQDNSVFPDMTVEENLLMGGYIKDQTEESYQEVEKILEKYESLRNRRSQPAKVLSGGERRLLEISRALVMKPNVLLVDEPSIGLEPKYIDMVFEILRDLQQNEKKTIILVEQNAKKGLEFADIGYVLVSGQTAIAGKGDDLLNNPDVGRLFLGG